MAIPFCAICNIPGTITHDAFQGISACTICGTISKEAGSEHLVVLGRTLEDEEHEAGRNYLRNGGLGYVGNVPIINGRTVKSEEDVSAYQLSQLNRTEKLMRVLLTHFHLESLFERSKVIFHQCRDIGRFQWGRKANLFAAASCYVAAREREKTIALKEIAELADLDTHPLVRAHLHIKTWLDIKTRELDALVYIERIIVHISRFLVPSPSTPHFTPKNLTWLRSIDLAKARSLSSSLVDMISKAADKLITGRQPENIAAATVLLCLEAVARTKAPIQIEFQNEVAKELGIKSYSISERYREIANLLADKREEIPWLSTGDVGGKSKMKGKKKKEVVEDAQDVITFWASAAKRKMQQDVKAIREELGENIDLLVENEETEVLADPLATPSARKPPATTTQFATQTQSEPLPIQSPPATYSQSPIIAPPALTPTGSVTPEPDTDVFTSPNSLKRAAPNYRRVRPGAEKRARTISEVAQSLSHSLVPVTLPFASASAPTTSIATSYLPHDAKSNIARRQLLAGEPMNKIIPKNGSSNGVMNDRRSRLDLLLLHRSADEITDEELFDEGELEGLLRSSAEVERESKGERYLETVEWETLKESKPPKKPSRGRKKLVSPSAEDDTGREPTPEWPDDYFEGGPKTKMNEEMRRRIQELLDDDGGIETDEEIRMGMGAVLGNDVDIGGLQGNNKQ